MNLYKTKGLKPIKLITILIILTSIHLYSSEKICENNESTYNDGYQKNVPCDFKNKIENVKDLRISGRNPSVAFNPNEAIKILTKMLEKKSDYYRGAYNMGLAYAIKDDYDKAIKYINKAIKIKERNGNISDISVYNSAGWIYNKSKKYDDAIKALKKGEEGINDQTYKSTKRSLYVNLGTAFYHKKDYEKSLKYFEKSQEILSSDYAKQMIKGIKELISY
jgi:tetratricopeptide (TPR) repeat protein